MARWRDGRDRQHVKTFTRKKNAQRHLNKTAIAVDDGSFAKAQPAPMAEVFKAWRTDLGTRVQLGEVRASTANTYSCNLRVHIAPELDGQPFQGGLGAYRSDKLTPRVMARWRAGLAEKVEAGEMSRKSFNNIFALLRSIVTWARDPARAYLALDPMVGQKRLKLRKREAEFLEDDEVAALLAAAAPDPEASALVYVMLFLGLRRGEAFGLKWQDIEANGEGSGRVHVRRSIYNGKVTETKTASSERSVDAPASVLEALGRHREATPPMEGDFMFHNDAGAPLDPNTWYGRVYKPLRKRAGLRDGVGLHTLRHSFASLLLRQGEGLKYTSEQLGHSSVQITGDRYGHVLKSQREQAMSRLDETIRAAKRGKLRVVGGTDA